jgi:hypothetical protein
MILSQELVRKMRRSQETYDLLAFIEHTYIPDEHFFAMLLLNPKWGLSGHIVNGTRRFIHFPKGSYHPMSLKNGHQKYLKDRGYFFARKLDPIGQSELADWFDEQRDLMDVELGFVRPEDLIGNSSHVEKNSTSTT